MVFHDLESLNDAILRSLEKFNARNLTRRRESRRQLFDSVGRDSLRPLAADRYQMRQRTVATVQRNSYVTLNKHHYSVPVPYVGKRVEIVYDNDTIGIFHGFTHVATHHRNDTPYGYMTKPSHNLPGRKGSCESDLQELLSRAAAFSESLQATFAETMTPDRFLNWLLSREWDYRVALNIGRLVKGANFRYNDASVAQIDCTLPRGLDRNQMERPASLDFVRKGDNLFITGCAGTGKSYLATALGYEACKAGMRVLYANASKLMGTLKIAKNKGTIETELKKLEKTQLLILNALFLVPLDAKERAHLTEIIEDRSGRKSIIVTSQLPELDWYDAIGDTTVADAILDRIVHTAHRITLTGESVRKLKAFKGR